MGGGAQRLVLLVNEPKRLVPVARPKLTSGIDLYLVCGITHVGF
jgi:hypothetical protein